MRPAILCALASLAISGCLAEMRLSRMKLELEGEVRSGRKDEAERTEARMIEIADDAFGRGTTEAVLVRTGLASSYAQWRWTDRSIRLAEDTVAQLDPEAWNQAIVPALLTLSNVQLEARRWKDSESTTDRLLSLCLAAPAHQATYEDPYDECHFAHYAIDDLYLWAGAYEKFAKEYLWWDHRDYESETKNNPEARTNGILRLAVLGRGYALYGAYPEALWYLRRCVDESRATYDAGLAPPSVRSVAASPSRDVEVFTLDSAHSFRSQSPRCLEDVIHLQRLVGEEAAANELDRWQKELWARGPDLEQQLVDRMQKSDRAWHDGYTTSHDANNLAFYYAGKGRTVDAIRTYREAIALIDAAYAKDGVFAGIHPTGILLDELMGLAGQCELAGLASDALAAYERGVGLADTELPPRDRRRLECQAGVARTLLSSGRPAESEGAWRRYLSVAGEIRGLEHADYAVGLEGLARTLEAAGRSAEAATLRKRAAAIRASYAKRIHSVAALPLPASLLSPSPPAN